MKSGHRRYYTFLICQQVRKPAERSATNISGGKLDGKKLECSLNLSLDVASAKADNTKITMDCSNFSCKWDGHDIACDDLKSRIEGSKTACTES